MTSQTIIAAMSAAPKPTTRDLGLPLREAPERFFDVAKWREFVSYFDNPEAALRHISKGEPGLLVFYRRQAARRATGELARRDEKVAALGRVLVADFLQRLIDGRLVATGLPAVGVERVTIPAERWDDLRPDFVAGSAAGGGLSLTAVRIYEAGEKPVQSTLLDRCVAFLQQRGREGESRRKVLFTQALAHFGEALTTRTFGEAYKIVFAKPRGRPRKRGM